MTKCPFSPDHPTWSCSNHRHQWHTAPPATEPTKQWKSAAPGRQTGSCSGSGPTPERQPCSSGEHGLHRADLPGSSWCLRAAHHLSDSEKELFWTLLFLLNWHNKTLEGTEQLWQALKLLMGLIISWLLMCVIVNEKLQVGRKGWSGKLLRAHLVLSVLVYWNSEHCWSVSLCLCVCVCINFWDKYVYEYRYCSILATDTAHSKPRFLAGFLHTAITGYIKGRLCHNWLQQTGTQP